MSKIDLNEVLASILTKNVNMSDEEYKQMLDEVSSNYESNQKNKDENYKAPTLEERRERVRMNFYGSITNFLFQILNTINEFYSNYAPMIEAIADKVGVEWEDMQTEEDKAMEAAAEYLRAGAEKRKAEIEALKKGE